MPEELFFVALVESEFEPRAVSKSGAVGLWQLMDFTAVGRGLRVGGWLDERRDFWIATEAALAILEANYERYGDWLLVLAAYNAGGGAVDRAIAKSGTRDFFKLAEGGFLPAETVSYVPKILAAAAFGTYRGRNRLPYSGESGVAWRRIGVTSPVDLRSLAELSGVPLERLRRANAELDFLITPPPGTGYFLKVTADDAAAVERALSLPAARLVAASVHTVRQGDTFYGLAGHYRIPLEMLLNYNPGYTPQTLPVGGRLVIPRREDAIPPPPRAVFFTGKDFSERYTVRPGDTLFGIAERFGVPVEELASVNRRTLDAAIRPGDTLNVPARNAEK